MRHPGGSGTRERILEVAAQSFGAYGYNGTRLHHIARRVGIQKASLFHYFPSKEHLFRAVVDEGIGETEQTLKAVFAAESSPRQKLRGAIEACVHTVAAHPERTKILIGLSIGDAPEQFSIGDSQRLIGMVTSFIREGQDAKIFAPIDPLPLVLSVAGMVAFFFTSATVVAPSWKCDPGDPACVERVTRYVVDITERCLGIADPFRAASDPAKAATTLSDAALAERSGANEPR